MEELKLNHRYLINTKLYYFQTTLSEITVLEVSQTSYFLEVNRNVKYWILKSEFCKEYDIIEDLGNVNLKQTISLDSGKETYPNDMMPELPYFKGLKPDKDFKDPNITL